MGGKATRPGGSLQNPTSKDGRKRLSMVEELPELAPSPETSPFRAIRRSSVEGQTGLIPLRLGGGLSPRDQNPISEEPVEHVVPATPTRPHLRPRLSFSLDSSSSLNMTIVSGTEPSLPAKMDDDGHHQPSTPNKNPPKPSPSSPSDQTGSLAGNSPIQKYTIKRTTRPSEASLESHKSPDEGQSRRIRRNATSPASLDTPVTSSASEGRDDSQQATSSLSLSHPSLAHIHPALRQEALEALESGRETSSAAATSSTHHGSPLQYQPMFQPRPEIVVNGVRYRLEMRYVPIEVTRDSTSLVHGSSGISGLRGNNQAEAASTSPNDMSSNASTVRANPTSAAAETGSPRQLGMSMSTVRHKPVPGATSGSNTRISDILAPLRINTSLDSLPGSSENSSSDEITIRGPSSPETTHGSPEGFSSSAATLRGDVSPDATAGSPEVDPSSQTRIPRRPVAGATTTGSPERIARTTSAPTGIAGQQVQADSPEKNENFARGLDRLIANIEQNLEEASSPRENKVSPKVPSGVSDEFVFTEETFGTGAGNETKHTSSSPSQTRHQDDGPASSTRAASLPTAWEPYENRPLIHQPSGTSLPQPIVESGVTHAFNPTPPLPPLPSIDVIDALRANNNKDKGKARQPTSSSIPVASTASSSKSPLKTNPNTILSRASSVSKRPWRRSKSPKSPYAASFGSSIKIRPLTPSDRALAHSFNPTPPLPPLTAPSSSEDVLEQARKYKQQQEQQERAESSRFSRFKDWASFKGGASAKSEKSPLYPPNELQAEASNRGDKNDDNSSDSSSIVFDSHPSVRVPLRVPVTPSGSVASKSLEAASAAAAEEQQQSVVPTPRPAPAVVGLGISTSSASRPSTITTTGTATTQHSRGLIDTSLRPNAHKVQPISLAHPTPQNAEVDAFRADLGDRASLIRTAMQRRIGEMEEEKARGEWTGFGEESVERAVERDVERREGRDGEGKGKGKDRVGSGGSGVFGGWL